MSKIEVSCNTCKNNFSIELKVFNEKTKRGQNNFYCGRSCFFDAISPEQIIKKCLFCNVEFTSTASNGSKKCCSTLCSSRYSHSFSNSKNTSTSMKEFWKNRNFKHKVYWCKCCGIKLPPKRYRQSCSIKCAKKLISLGSRKSVETQSKNRRSKNERHFAELCQKHFSNVECNKPIFNGWDADVILHDQKIAVLWNGIWHYEKVKESHSVKQVQNRDQIKIQEIKKHGYTPYVIEDRGKEDVAFVKDSFNTFLLTLKQNRV